MPILARSTTPTAGYSEIDPITDAGVVAEDLLADFAPARPRPDSAMARPPRDPTWRVLIAGGHRIIR